MTPDIALVLVILLAALVLFVTDWVRMDVVALLVLSALAATGLVAPAQAVAGFSNPAVVTVWAMFILSEGLARAGIAEYIGHGVLRAAGRSEARMIAILMLVAGALSGFMNNIGVAALMLPIAVDIARRSGVASSRLLTPLAYGTLLGGLTTLIGPGGHHARREPAGGRVRFPPARAVPGGRPHRIAGFRRSRRGRRSPAERSRARHEQGAARNRTDAARRGRRARVCPHSPEADRSPGDGCGVLDFFRADARTGSCLRSARTAPCPARQRARDDQPRPGPAIRRATARRRHEEIDMSKRDAYIEKMKARIDEWNADIDKLEAKAREARADMKIEYQEQLSAMRLEREKARGKLHELQEATEDAWEGLREGMESAWESMAKAFKDAADRFK
jgi:hypothetical protein